MNDTPTGFSDWAVWDRHRYHDHHTQLATRFLRPSDAPYPDDGRATFVAGESNGRRRRPLTGCVQIAVEAREAKGPKAEVRRAVESWNVAVPPPVRQTLAERIQARREAVRP